MDPTSPPWRVLDAPNDTERAASPFVATAAETRQVTLTASVIKAIAAGIAAIGCAVLAFVVAFAGGSGETVLLAGGSGLDGADGSSVAPADAVAAGPNAELVVEIVGAVLRPGVFHLAAGARVGDLVAAAGGYGPRVDTAAAELSLNLAAVLHDGDRIRVPSRDDPAATDAPTSSSGGSGSGTPGSGTGPVDVNVATEAELDALPGVGPATIEKILAAREEAPFTTVDELRTRGIVGEKTLEKLRPLVVVR